MNYNKHINNCFQEQIENIENILYYPWVGFNYQTHKTLVIGESVYNWGKNELERKEISKKFLKNKLFAQIVIYEQGILNPFKSRKFVRNIEKIFNKENSNIEFWESVSFHEFVQRPMESLNHRPNKIDYINGAKILSNLLNILKPRKCIFLGTSWSKFINIKNILSNNYLLEEKHFEKINNAYPKIIEIYEFNLKIYFIKHPSRGFNIEKWKNFIYEN